MADDLLRWLAEASIVLGVVAPLVLLIGRVARGRVGAGWIYAMWLAVPAALLASLAPDGLVASPLSVTVWADGGAASGAGAPEAAGGATAAAFPAALVLIWLTGAAAFLALGLRR